MRYARFALARIFIELAAICLPHGPRMKRAFILLMAANTAIKRDVAAMKGGEA